MNLDDYNRLKIRYQSSTSEELHAIVSAPDGDYRTEAVLVARDILASRSPQPDNTSNSQLEPKQLTAETCEELTRLIETAPEPPVTPLQILYSWRGRLSDRAHSTYFYLSLLATLGLSIGLFYIPPLAILLAPLWLNMMYIYLALKHKRKNDMGEDATLARIFMSFGKYSSLRPGNPFPNERGLPYGTTRAEWAVNPNDPDLPFHFRGHPLRDFLTKLVEDNP